MGRIRPHPRPAHCHGRGAGRWEGRHDLASGGLKSFNVRNTPVGASLLAIAECQTTLLSTDTPPSRASPLPHFFVTSLAFIVL
ncbi:hypothetical protein F7R20_20350 [Pseudomonas brassicacearum subsp. brassicacearum]|nr:hypothetical protein F7R20_20350 [Pseudomonas brassicacearum subsp. brassicacearum]PJH87393.1 hypothetical protein CVG87_19240 [Pseudomonas sp. WCS365]QEO79735.1 hypothetical protein ELZ14_20005 [Pseudomonas brassicacearum]